MANVKEPDGPFPFDIETLIIGAGAAGLIAALAAHDAGQSVLVLERSAVPSGSTALSAGLIPAAGTRFQTALGIGDDAELFGQDIQRKAHFENDENFVGLLARNSASTIEWLADEHGLPFSVVNDFDYPGHSRRRMHGLPSRSGQELIDHLRTACERGGVEIICEATVETLFAKDGVIKGVSLSRGDGSREEIGCGRLILACNGYGGNRQHVQNLMPEIEDALWFGHDGNKGEALDWGEALGAATHHLSAYQGHGNVAHPHGILITWAVITQGGFQINKLGERFWDESKGYSEAAREVMAQPDGEAYAIFDGRIASIARQFADFQDAEAQGAIKQGDTVEELAKNIGVPADALAKTMASIPQTGSDKFGREFDTPKLTAPFMGVRVTGALFHTQGGLVVNENAQVCKPDGSVFENLYAAGGAAVGVSGSGDSGYLSGNGLLSAAVLGRLAGSAP